MKRIDFIKKTLCCSVVAALGLGLLESCEDDELFSEVSENSEIIKFKSKREETARSGHQTYMIVDNIIYSTLESGKSIVTFDLLIAYSLINQHLVVKSDKVKSLDYVQTKRAQSSTSKVKQRKVAINGNIYDLKDYRENIKRVSVPIASSGGAESPIHLISINQFNERFSKALTELI
ncbi:hypothetical protein PQ465_04910 [Sphingobacterium oryzagri]|uniref:DUF4136 domain-containing protein n=1 Tax=Sphingobacterium oryzagri TaxID=3025669 RepID=A0ABY7WJH4_9SPHI|nr:hypothetical protein [Sphingobacterium sp. KACC 22765]WDF69722.1 hypothetical protein PQ465_04910 [Sphingobacterium sp. KACC 22765]